MKGIINILDKVDVFSTPKTIEFEGVEINIFEKIHSDKKRVLAEFVVGSSLIKEDDIAYIDEVSRDIITKYAIMQYYTDIEMSMLLSSTKSKNVFELIDRIEHIGLYDKIIEVIDKDELSKLNKYIDLRVKSEKEVQELEYSVGYQLKQMTTSVLEELSETLKEGQLENAMKELKLQTEIMNKKDKKDIKEKLEETMTKSLVKDTE